MTKYKWLECVSAIAIAKSHAIADTGATLIFIMKGTPVNNLRKSDNPITISLPDGSKVTSTHICDITIQGLPTVLTGHIVPGTTMASLIGIRILCKAGFKVVIDDKKCEVFYKNNNIKRIQRPDHWLMDTPHLQRRGCKDHPGINFGTPPKITHDAQPPCETRRSANQACNGLGTAVTMGEQIVQYQNDPDTTRPLSRSHPAQLHHWNSRILLCTNHQNQ